MDKTELTPTPPDKTDELKSEQQLSVTLDDIKEKTKIMSADEYLKIQKSLKEQGTAAPETAKKPVEPPKTPNADNLQSAKKDMPNLPSKRRKALRSLPPHTFRIWKSWSIQP